MKNALTSNCYILGDFNLDARMEGIDSFNYKLPLCNLTEFALNNKLQQIIDFCTWSRIVNGVEKESLLDHVYVTDLATIKAVHYLEPVFGDHVLVIIELHSKIDLATNVHVKRNWKGYATLKMDNLVSGSLGSTCCAWDDLSVQEHWNVLENVIINSIDALAPLDFIQYYTTML